MQKALLIFIGVLLPTILVSQSRHAQIKTELAHLSTYVGNWNVESKFTSRSGNTRIERGTYRLRWALDSTYIQWEAELTNIGTDRRRCFLSMVTYDPTSEDYVQTYFYSRRPNKITVNGTFDRVEGSFVTQTVLTLSDGTREDLRNVLSMETADRAVSRAWASFDGGKEVNNATAVWTRIRK